MVSIMLKKYFVKTFFVILIILVDIKNGVLKKFYLKIKVFIYNIIKIINIILLKVFSNIYNLLIKRISILI